MNNIERNILISSITATMAYLESDGLSGIDPQTIRSGGIKTTIYSKDTLFRSDLLSGPTPIDFDRDEWVGDVARNLPHSIRKLVAINWELRDSRNALLSAPGIDFDIFDISEEDAFDSLQYRGIGSNMAFGYEFMHEVDETDDWLDDQPNHGSWDTDDMDELCRLIEACRIGDCDGECRY